MRLKWRHPWNYFIVHLQNGAYLNDLKLIEQEVERLLAEEESNAPTPE